jgi:hypothetical protein
MDRTSCCQYLLERELEVPYDSAVTRSARTFVMIALTLLTLVAAAQTDPLTTYFLGKEVLVKIDMPGS